MQMVRALSQALLSHVQGHHCNSSVSSALARPFNRIIPDALLRFGSEMCH